MISNEVDWKWVQTQWEEGHEVSKIADTYRGVFGVPLKEGTIRVRAHRHGWKRYKRGPSNLPANYVTDGVGVIDVTLPNSGNLDEECVRDVIREGNGGGDSNVPSRIVTHDYKVAKANAILEEVERDHIRRSNRLKDEADKLLRAVGERLSNPDGLKTGEIRDLAQSLDKAATIQQRAIDQERKLHGLDKDVTTSGNTPITQIAIVCSSPPTVIQNDTM